MKISLENLKVGDKVYVQRSYSGWGVLNYVPSVIVKITPKGLIDVAVGVGGAATRFNKNGNQYGDHRFGDCIDTEFSFSERKSLIEQGERKVAAAKAMEMVKCESIRNPEYQTQAYLYKLLQELQAKLDAARELVNAIKEDNGA